MRFMFILVAALASSLPSAYAQTDDWVTQKCAIFAGAWNDALDDLGSDELNYAFIAGGENFIAGGCTERVDLCPRSDQELDIANRLSLAMINAGAASTFLPFRCDDAPAEGGWTGPGL